MLALVGFSLFILGVALYWGTLNLLGIFRRVPVEQYGAFAGAAAIGLYLFVRDPSLLHGALFAMGLSSLGGLVWYVHWGSIFPREMLALVVGDQFPEISLPDSEGHVFHSRSLEGVGSALYLFFRGDW